MGCVRRKPPRWLKVGAVVDYHSLINPLGPVTLSGATVRGGPSLLGGHIWVVWLDGKSGCVAVEAVTPAIRGGR